MAEIVIKKVVIGMATHLVPPNSEVTLCGLPIKGAFKGRTGSDCRNCRETEPGYLLQAEAEAAGARF